MTTPETGSETIWGKPCPGCGAPLQHENPQEAGYVPLERERARDLVLCRRCWRMRHYGALEGAAPGQEQVRKAVASALRAAHAVLWVVDVVDFEGTAHPSLFAPWAARLKRGENLWVAVNKVDLLPRHVPPREVTAWVRGRFRELGWEPRGVEAVSAATGWGVEALWNRVREDARRVAMVGATNTGKSTLLQSFLALDQLGAPRKILGKGRGLPLGEGPTVSPFPGTTAGLIRLPLAAGGELLDTPGLETEGGRYGDGLCGRCAAQLAPSEALQGALYPLRPGQALHWSGLAGFTILETPGGGEAVFIAFAPSAAAPVRTRGENLAARLVSGGRSPAGPWCGACRQHLAQRPWETVEVTVPAGHDLAVAGLGWVSVRTGPVRLALQLPAGVWYRVRPNLVGRKEASGQGAGPQGLGAAGFGRPAPKHGRTAGDARRFRGDTDAALSDRGRIPRPRSHRRGGGPPRRP